ncbi:MAG: hypothetical protein NTV43_00195 [Methylococcales bacterium]|nr:hypothetical protein [Methylococcales bacterium]
MRRSTKLILLVATALSQPGCITATPRNNPLKTLMIEECAEQRRSGTGFNSKKSHQLVRYECGQILTKDEDYRRIDDPRFRKRPDAIAFEDQEDFDAETWFIITETMREKYYPDYLAPEQEIIRANALAEQQAKTITDESLMREWEPRLLPVSPYLMHHTQLGLAQEAIDALIDQKRGDEFSTKLRVISRIISSEQWRKDPYRLH